MAQTSNYAMEALAGLASKEDFTSVALKKSSELNTSFVPFKSLMLLQIKGRRNVQTRMVEPIASNINQGDNFVLITPKELYHFVGKYSNCIEQSRASDIVHHIQQTNDLGCKTSRIITLNGEFTSKDSEKFWKLLGSDGEVQAVDAGHPEEDEIYESNIASTNMFYQLEHDELVPIDQYWGKIPKIDMLQSNKVIVLDFGSEMYVWSGKTAPISEKKIALQLAKDLWSEGYNYSDCGMCPLNVASILGKRDEEKSVSLKSNSRPEWALFAKLTQHRETILFKEKFLDWPDFSRIIKVKESEKPTESSIEINPCNAEEMLKYQPHTPVIEVDGNRHFQIETLSIKMWSIFTDTFEEVKNDDIGNFYDCDTYILRWQFRVTVTGRDLSGKPSKHAVVGRERCLYFFWLGQHSSVNEKGVAALLTVQLDSENTKQIRITQGLEPPVFYQIFEGKMCIHKGKRDNKSEDNDIKYKNKSRLYVIRGDIKEESVLIEIPCNKKNLRTKGSFVLINNDKLYVWHGAKSPEHTRKLAKDFANYISEKCPSHFSITSTGIDILEVNEDDYDKEFLSCLEGDLESYHSLVGSDLKLDVSPRLFHMSSVSGSFKATEILCPHRSEKVTPFPFLQKELYSVSQPGKSKK